MNSARISNGITFSHILPRFYRWDHSLTIYIPGVNTQKIGSLQHLLSVMPLHWWRLWSHFHSYIHVHLIQVCANNRLNLPAHSIHFDLEGCLSVTFVVFWSANLSSSYISMFLQNNYKNNTINNKLLKYQNKHICTKI